jgi:hypothetical protein
LQANPLRAAQSSKTDGDPSADGDLSAYTNRY